MEERNGRVRKYKVFVINSDQISEHTSTVDAQVTSLIVSNLVHNTYYCVQLMAYTVADGILSACVNVTTVLKGKSTFKLNVSSAQNGAEECEPYLQASNLRFGVKILSHSRKDFFAVRI